MLISLEIKNYAIIDHLFIEFDKGLNIITGETGAGKSILLGALGLTLGNRADSKVLHQEKSKCIIEAIFSVSSYHLKAFFEQYDLDYQDETSLRREITQRGTSRAFINDTPVTLETLRSLAEKLVNLTSQNETQQLNAPSYQLAILDVVARNENVLQDYKKAYHSFKEGENKLNHLKEEHAQLQKDVDYYQFQFNEIEEAAIEDLNAEELEHELNQLNNAEEIQEKLLHVSKLLEEEEINALQLLRNTYQYLRDVSKYNSSIEQLAERVNSSIIELEDIYQEVANEANHSEFDEERISFLTLKLNEINRLMRKHQVDSVTDLLEVKNQFESNLLKINTNTGDIKRWEEELALRREKLNKLAQKLSLARHKAKDSAKNRIEKTLHKVGMPNAVFEINLTEKSDFSEQGKDTIEFLFNANKGFAPQAMRNIASGGELSRLMLSIQALLAKNTALPTLIFDEIDTGISGETAAKVADVFTQISKEHQLIAITHLPQIAAKAERHFFIYKSEQGEKTNTKIKILTPEKHIKAIARMLSGETITEESLKNAKQLINS